MQKIMYFVDEFADDAYEKISYDEFDFKMNYSKNIKIPLRTTSKFVDLPGGFYEEQNAVLLTDKNNGAKKKKSNIPNVAVMLLSPTDYCKDSLTHILDKKSNAIIIIHPHLNMVMARQLRPHALFLKPLSFACSPRHIYNIMHEISIMTKDSIYKMNEAAYPIRTLDLFPLCPNLMLLNYNSIC